MNSHRLTHAHRQTDRQTDGLILSHCTSNNHTYTEKHPQTDRQTDRGAHDVTEIDRGGHNFQCWSGLCTRDDAM